MYYDVSKYLGKNTSKNKNEKKRTVTTSGIFETGYFNILAELLKLQ